MRTPRGGRSTFHHRHHRHPALGFSTLGVTLLSLAPSPIRSLCVTRNVSLLAGDNWGDAQVTQNQASSSPNNTLNALAYPSFNRVGDDVDGD